VITEAARSGGSPARPADRAAASPAVLTGDGRVVVGIGELAVTDAASSVLVTHALGSCIAVCIWDPLTAVAGLLHFLLPDSRLNPERAQKQPGAFADTGIPLLFRSAYARGLEKSRCRVWLAGGAEVASLSGHGSLNVGKRNLLTARSILWKNSVLVHGEATGGTIPRTVKLTASHGRLEISTGCELIEVL
jgi:chemotaxis protein CheD